MEDQELSISLAEQAFVATSFVESFQQAQQIILQQFESQQTEQQPQTNDPTETNIDDLPIGYLPCSTQVDSSTLPTGNQSSTHKCNFVVSASKNISFVDRAAAVLIQSHHELTNVGSTASGESSEGKGTRDLG
jgi:hypothetical protein